MSYKEATIKEVVKQIVENKIYLPAIQRKFVWGHEQIIELFDSIMKGYPIGTFLFWKLRGKAINQYTFYKFIQEYHERDNYINEIAPNPKLAKDIIGILDGQQRLSSMYIALQGTYAYKKPYARWDDNAAFPKRTLCLNLLKKPDVEDEDKNNYEFQFLPNEQIREQDAEHFWFPVRKVLEWKEVSNCVAFAIENKKVENQIFLENLTTLWKKLTSDNLISYFEIMEVDLDQILKIFVRINSGGTILSKTDLLFSTIVANWEKGREEIEALLEDINGRGDGFNFSNDFIMRACLTLTDCPVLFKVNNFKKENIKKIKDEWENIKNSIQKSIDLLVEFGFNWQMLSSQMAVIIIAHYIYKGGDLGKEAKEIIRKYLVLSMINRIYGGQPDQVITKIREVLKKNENNFSLEEIEENLPGGKSLILSEDRLEEIFNENKGAYTFMLLSMLYPHLKLGQVKFHQDHIHPASLFDFDTVGSEYYYKRDKLANLQLLEGSENESKNNTPFINWIEKIKDKNSYYKSNFIPNDTSLELKDFKDFYERRKEIMKTEITKLLKINSNIEDLTLD